MKAAIHLLLVAVLLGGGASAAQAACFADYKAKREDAPLRLHYGVARVRQCSTGAARDELTPRLARNGWTLLTVISVFDRQGLQERRADAGAYFLRY